MIPPWAQRVLLSWGSAARVTRVTGTPASASRSATVPPATPQPRISTSVSINSATSYPSRPCRFTHGYRAPMYVAARERPSSRWTTRQRSSRHECLPPPAVLYIFYARRVKPTHFPSCGRLLRIGMMPWILLASGHALTQPWLDARSWMCYETDASLVASLSPCANFANSVFRL